MRYQVFSRSCEIGYPPPLLRRTGPHPSCEAVAAEPASELEVAGFEAQGERIGYRRTELFQSAHAYYAGVHGGITGLLGADFGHGAPAANGGRRWQSMKRVVGALLPQLPTAHLVRDGRAGLDL